MDPRSVCPAFLRGLSPPWDVAVQTVNRLQSALFCPSNVEVRFRKETTDGQMVGQSPCKVAKDSPSV